ncbi:hypothetical protein PVAND_017152 [Polypedilum vanderplanki]|uniref:Beta-sarcoglycan n=1 Tax=Polypedilum vanderplanki TaxID=319348 RepID=A0A9J6BHH5_POLVA|nr:hypothetical protein PVAND_017152 [Polypedilum vanderplanki]
MGSKGNKCVNLTLKDPTSLFFWALIVILFILVIGNFILTLSIISFFKIGMGMESIEIVPEAKTIKFFGSADFNKVYKKDGLIESFKDVPLKIEANNIDSSIKLNTIDRKGQVHNRLSIDNHGIHLKSMSELFVKDPDTESKVFTTEIKMLNNVNKPARNLIANSIHASEIVSPVNHKLQVKSMNMFVKGIEGTVIDGKEVLISVVENISLKSLNDSFQMFVNDGIYINTGRLPISMNSMNGSRLQNKLYACYDKKTEKYTLMQVKLRFDSDLKYIKC